MITWSAYMESRFKYHISLHNFNVQGRQEDKRDKEEGRAPRQERQRENRKVSADSWNPQAAVLRSGPALPGTG